MKTFELPVTDGKPLEIVDFKVDLLLSPPIIREAIISDIDPYIAAESDALKIEYKDASLDEGHLNIYLCRFNTGKYILHIFGKINGTEFRTEKELSKLHSHSIELNDRVKYVLARSRNILKTYYLSANHKSIEDHLLAFLIPT